MIRKRFVGRHLMIRGKFAEAILGGEKNLTIRLGIVRPKYDEVIIHSGGRPIAVAKIKNVKHTRFGELTINDAKRDGFTSLSALRRELSKLYNSEISDNDWVTVIEFEIIKRLDRIKDPYEGLEPGHLARIALRYLDEELSEEDIRILRDLTVTNSIRSTAKRLYGRWDKRKKIREVLRRAVTLLRERDII
ncbi:MAG: ASCH domain-containing protein [Desulfurococcales archaeon]|nr:ASCH domain-containing protein [Desulfurococcales archaeon]